MELRRALVTAAHLFLASAALARAEDAQPAAPAAPVRETRDLMPVPSTVEWKEGLFTVDEKWVLMTPKGPADPRVDQALARFGAWLQKEAGLTAPLRTAGEGGALSIEWAAATALHPGVGEDESYELTVAERDVKLKAATSLGALRGLETLRQLVRVEKGIARIPAVHIIDRPRFPWRGLLVDVSRHFMPVDAMKRTLDGMAAVKLNVLHWHLSDDQGFRVESKKLPKLHTVGSGGAFYTQAQVQDIVEYARLRGIRVVPEFDTPGHTTSWLAAYPELGSSAGPFAVSKRWSIHDDNLDPTKDAVYTFLETFWGEMATLFPDEYVHIGGDEVMPRRWNDNPKIAAYMAAHGMRDHQDLQAHFNTRLVEILGKLKKKAVGWDEVLHKDLPKSAVVQSWRGAASLSQAAWRGYDVLLSAGYYLDLMEPASKHYAADPLSEKNELNEEGRKHVLGGEACMWAEFVSAEILDQRLWPRAAAVAERLWSPGDVRDVDDMYRRLAITSQRLAGLGLTHLSTPEAMLKRLAGKHPVEPLKAFAKILEPVKGYRRLDLRDYRSDTPLDRLIDSIPPESDTARQFERAFDSWLAGKGDAFSPMRRTLEEWKAIASVQPILDASPELVELRTLPKDIENLALLSHQCLDYFLSGYPSSNRWVNESLDFLDAAAKPRGGVQPAVIHAVRKLLVAAANRQILMGMGVQTPLPREQWNEWVNTETARLETARAAALH